MPDTLKLADVILAEIERLRESNTLRGERSDSVWVWNMLRDLAMLVRSVVHNATPPVEAMQEMVSMESFPRTELMDRIRPAQRALLSRESLTASPSEVTLAVLRAFGVKGL